MHSVSEEIIPWACIQVEKDSDLDCSGHSSFPELPVFCFSLLQLWGLSLQINISKNPGFVFHKYECFWGSLLLCFLNVYRLKINLWTLTKAMAVNVASSFPIILIAFEMLVCVYYWS